MFRPCWFALLAAAAFAGCASPSYVYQFVPGKTASLEGGCATAPPDAPDRVQAAIAAANRIAGTPYGWGGGHREGIEGFDCSGATSYVLREAGLMTGSTTSRGFRRFGESGEGEWISIYASRHHVFLVLAGLRFDTGWTGEAPGPRWTTKSRPAPGAVIRHPARL